MIGAGMDGQLSSVLLEILPILALYTQAAALAAKSSGTSYAKHNASIEYHIPPYLVLNIARRPHIFRFLLQKPKKYIEQIMNM